MIQADSSLPSELLNVINPYVLKFLIGLKSGSLARCRDYSFSTAAALEMVDLYKVVISCFVNYENTGNAYADNDEIGEFPERIASFGYSDGGNGELTSFSIASCGSPTIQKRKLGISEEEVASSQVSRLLELIVRTSRVLIRPQFVPLLLSNVTRRVLSIVREAAADARATEEQIDSWRASSPPGGGSEYVFSDGYHEKNVLEKEVVHQPMSYTLDGSHLAQRHSEKDQLSPLSPPPAAQSSSSIAPWKAVSPNALLTSPILRDGGEGSEKHRVKKSFSPSRGGISCKERTSSSIGSGFFSGNTSQVIGAVAPPRSTDTQVTVPGQHSLRRAPSLRDPTSETPVLSLKANIACELSSSERGLCTSSTTSSRSNSTGTPLRLFEGGRNEVDDCVSPMSVPSPSSFVSTPGPRRNDAVSEKNAIPADEDTGAVAAGAVETPDSFVPSPSPSFSVAHEFPVRLHDFYENCLEGLNEFLQEIETMTSELCNSVDRQIHRGDVLITIGYTHTLRAYLLAASKKKSFRVLLLEGDPTPPTMVSRLAADLTKQNIDVRCLPDSAAFAVMNTCTKVVVGAESVLANGGMLAPNGTRMLCVAARHFSVPVLVPTTTLKMSPYYPSDSLCSRLVRITKGSAQELPWSMHGAPERVLPLPHGLWVDPFSSSVRTHNGETHGHSGSCGVEGYSSSDMKVSFLKVRAPHSRPPLQQCGSSHPGTLDGDGARNGTIEKELTSNADAGWIDTSLCRSRRSRLASSLILSQVSVHCTTVEYVPPELVTLYATNESQYTPSQCHRITRANYNDAD